MPVLTPEDAAQILNRLRLVPPDLCDLCKTPFSDAVPARQTTLGAYQAWVCDWCLERHEAMPLRPRTR
jgi:hypothetical protein